MIRSDGGLIFDSEELSDRKPERPIAPHEASRGRTHLGPPPGAFRNLRNHGSRALVLTREQVREVIPSCAICGAASSPLLGECPIGPHESERLQTAAIQAQKRWVLSFEPHLRTAMATARDLQWMRYLEVLTT